ncbi:MAG: amidophosphoribosyltransferase [Candidatus Omnitrophica bacterium CG11_big_fil_rev_8_21_14_0_20_64_10]|nr:MAG: amidophosphoribosyltransferase [Candidatus Omnitrophica bacterium CG11_big_fil_rev_8_21_14_0_20_64_10]
MGDEAREHCGLFGVYNHPDAVRLTYLGLFSLQHRGEESAGIVASDGRTMTRHVGMGMVHEVFTPENLSALTGSLAIGHTRYSTTGSSRVQNAQPLQVDFSRGSVAIAHNGNLINALLLRDELEAHGSIFQTTIDSEVVLHLLADPRYGRFEAGLVDTLTQLKGAFSLLILREDALIGVRDPNGFRPLCIGRIGEGWVLASESCALDLIGAQFVREVEPGEVVIIDRSGLRSIKPFPKTPLSHCIFEHVYFARPDSVVFGESVHQVRRSLGRMLAREHPVEADVVIAIPDSGNSAALGYSQESGIPLDIGITRNHYVGRTFIQPRQRARDFQVRVKFNPVRSVLAGKRVVVVDDSIVRGTTCRARLKSIREAGAKEIHMRVSCPPIRHPCFYGIDFPTRKELIANTHSLEEIRSYLEVDSLGYLSIEGLLKAVNGRGGDYCTACYSGKYPLDFGSEADKYILERKFAGEAHPPGTPPPDYSKPAKLRT